MKPDKGATTLTAQYPPLRIETLLRYKPRPEEYIVGEGFIRRGAGTLLQSYTGQGKSVLAEQWAIQMAGGLDIWGMKVRGPRRVLYAAAEGDEATWARDFRAILDHVKPSMSLVKKNFVLVHMYGATDREFAPALADQVALHDPEVVIVDNFQGFVTGELNSSQCFREWIRDVDILIKKCRIGLLLLDHFPKPRDETPNDDPRLGVYRGAGHSGKSNWARTSVELICPRPEMGLRRFYLNFSKCAERTGLTEEDESGAKLPLRRLYVEWSKDVNVPYWEKSADQESDRVAKGSVAAMIDRYHETDDDKSCGEIARVLGCSRSTVTRHFRKKGWKVR